MKKLLSYSHSTEAGHALYLHYSDKSIAGTMAMNETESVAIDMDDDGEVVGIELLDPDAESLELLRRIAREKGLSLEGFDGTLIA